MSISMKKLMQMLHKSENISSFSDHVSGNIESQLFCITKKLPSPK